eukprot:TRINITY_DN51002_c0_g1_i1.p1 TRINITY_DN51002_c0_g1~~TRINITY_DN51002_c0_g1_i1.p1  ORF type:complete len:463 (-),score=141.10 TRINITY_DN51002_c0_g1_i1:27-1415(-)
MSALDRLLAGKSGAQQGAGGKNKRKDVLDGLGDFGAPSSKKGAGGARPVGGLGLGGLSVPGGAKSQPKAAAKKSSDVDAMKQWLQSMDDDKAASAVASAKPVSKPAAAKSVDVPGSDPATSSAAPEAVKDAEQATASAEEGAPAIVTAEDVKKGWKSIFAAANNKWDIEQESGRGLYWNSESGLCFEWDQEAGTLYQFSEADGKPVRCAIWSTACPDQHAWIWDQLPLPPTDPAAQQAAQMDSDEEDGPAGSQDAEQPPAAASCSVAVQAAEPAAPAESGGGPPSAAAPEEPAKQPAASATTSSSAGGSMMPPPAMLPKKRPPPEAGSAGGSMPPPSLLPKKAKPAADSAVSPMPPPPAKEKQPSEKSLSDEMADDLNDAEDAIGPRLQGPELPPKGASSSTSLLVDKDESDDEDAQVAGPLAEGDAAALPAAPSDKAKPSACDLELDMFGEPEENSMAVAD